MPADTAEKRFSAIHITCPWRGVNVTPSAINQGERQAVMFMYSGILAAGGAAAEEGTKFYMTAGGMKAMGRRRR